MKSALNKKVYMKVNSSPIKKDTDGDNISDLDDANPKVPFDSRFNVVSDLSYVPATPTEDKFEEESNRVYNTLKGEKQPSYGSANMQVKLFGNMPAARALNHFLDNSGDTYTFNNDSSVLKTYRGKENLAKNINTLLKLGEETVKVSKNITFASNVEFNGTDYSRHLEDIADIGWWYAIGYTRATMVSNIKNIDDQTYEMDLKYRIVDFYDWDKDQTYLNGGFGGLISDAEMYNLHTFGYAKQYRINMEFNVKIRWNKGDRYYLNNIYLWDTPSTMNVSIS